MALIGAWTDEAAYALHHATPRIQEIFEMYEQWLEHAPHVVRLEPPIPSPTPTPTPTPTD